MKSVDIYTGSYSARFGYATGGIINIEGKDQVKKNASTINFNLYLSDAMVERKITDKSYVIAAARKSYPNVTLLKTLSLHLILTKLPLCHKLIAIK